MRHEALYARAPNVEAPWRVSEVDLNPEQGEVVVHVEHAGETLNCPECGQPARRYDTRRRRWRHLDTGQYRTTLVAEMPRVRCERHHVRQVAAPWSGEGRSRFTSRFEAVVIDRLREAPRAAVAQQMGLSWDEVDRIMQRAAQRGAGLERRDVPAPRRIGVDEMLVGEHESGNVNALDRIVASLHDAALGSAHWGDASALIDEACGMAGTHLVIVDRNRTNPEWLFDLFYYHGEHAAELATDYVERFFPGDERVPRLLRLPDRHVVPMTDLYTEPELKSSPTYNDLLRRTGARQGLNVRMDGPPGTSIVWVTTDPTSGAGWSTAQIGMIERLLPHVRQFVRVRQALAVGGALGASLLDLLDNDLIGVLYLDRRGTIVEANSRARQLLATRDGLRDEGGFLKACSASEDAKLGKLLARVLPRRGDAGVSGSLSLRSGPLGPRMVLHATPVNAGGMNHFGARVPAALVLIVEPGATPRIDPGLIASTYGLTHAESLVAAALAQGESVRTIAAATRRREQSVRWLVHQVHQKLGISRQADLVRMVLSIAKGVPTSGPEDSA